MKCYIGPKIWTDYLAQHKNRLVSSRKIKYKRTSEVTSLLLSTSNLLLLVGGVNKESVLQLYEKPFIFSTTKKKNAVLNIGLSFTCY